MATGLNNELTPFIEHPQKMRRLGTLSCVTTAIAIFLVHAQAVANSGAGYQDTLFTSQKLNAVISRTNVPGQLSKYSLITPGGRSLNVPYEQRKKMPLRSAVLKFRLIIYFDKPTRLEVLKYRHELTYGSPKF